MKIGIIGTGLIGGSLGQALKRSNKNYKVYCWNRREGVSKQALRLKAADKYFESIEALTKNSEIIIIATPLSSYPNICKKIAKNLDGKKIISDVGSVKSQPVLLALKEIPTNLTKNFIPAHPIAGKEKGGIANAESDLFKNKRTIITPFSKNQENLNKIKKLWKDAGSKTEILDSKLHDEIYAYVSHYVQFLSHTMARSFPKNMGDFSRLMNSPKDIWEEIFQYNRLNLRRINLIFIKTIEKRISGLKEGKAKDEYHFAAQLIAQTLVDITPKTYKKYAGSGYKSFTSVLSKANNKGKKVDIKLSKKILKRVVNDLKKAKL